MSGNESEHNGGIGDQAIEPRYLNLMNALASVIDDSLNGFPQSNMMPKHLRRRKTGFVLLVFPFDDKTGRCNYIGTAERNDAIKLFEEQLKRMKAQRKKDARRNKP